MPAVGNVNPVGVAYRDYSGEVKNIRLYAGELTAVTLPGFLTKFGALQTALDVVTLGQRAKTSWGEETYVSNDPASTKPAQVETEILVRVQGATTERPWSFRIPTADYDAFNFADLPARDHVIISGAGASAATVALVAAIEDLCRMPDDNTEAVSVIGMNVVR
jgi:hypothetical protein